MNAYTLQVKTGQDNFNGATSFLDSVIKFIVSQGGMTDGTSWAKSNNTLKISFQGAEGFGSTVVDYARKLDPEFAVTLG